MRLTPNAAVVVALLLPLAGRTAAAQSVLPPRWAASVDSMMARELRRTNTPGAQIAVARDGRVVYLKSYGVTDLESGRRVNDRTAFQVGSVSKLYTAVLVAQLASAGALDLHAPVSRYVTELAGREAGNVTLHELLTHSAGWRIAAQPFGRSDDAALGEEYRALGDTIFVPGLRGTYSYSNPSFEMAAYVAERAAGRPFASALDSLLLRPLGLSRTALRPMVAMTRDFALGHENSTSCASGEAAPCAARRVVRPMPGNSAEWGSGFLFTNADETAQLAIALMDGGMLYGVRVLPADAVRAVTTGWIPRPDARGHRVGYGMNVDSVGGRVMWQKSGSQPGFRALVTMWPAARLAVVVLTNYPESDLTDRATAFAARAAAGIEQPSAPAIAEREPTAAERAALVGSYKTARGQIELREVNGRLELKRVAYSVPVRMTGTDRFVITVPDGPPVNFVVVRDSAGGVRFLHSNELSYPRMEGR